MKSYLCTSGSSGITCDELSSCSSSSGSSTNCATKSQGYWKNHPDDPTWFLLQDCIDNEFDVDKLEWNFVAPRGDSTYNIAGGNLTINVPQGDLDHDPFTQLYAPRYVTDLSKFDDPNNWTVETKILSGVSQRFQIQGIILENDPLNFVRCEVFSDGSGTVGYLQTTINGSPNGLTYQPFPNGIAPIFITVKNENGMIKLSVSDGVISRDNSLFFNPPINFIGVHAGNAVGAGSPAHTAVFEYFRDINCESLGPDTDFFLSGLTWLEVLQKKKTKGDPYFKLAKQYIAAVLNLLAGAPANGIQAIVDEATILFEQYGPGQLPNRRRALRLAEKLKRFNECD